ncbi:cyclase [Mycolicibacterium chitae]|uniref:Cyclase family protein n=3 Tax=Mycolicibacterium TaxID=1866885 RepID=A0A448IEP8_MYCCI|nr:cyclase family protein [Mycolicibacterium chitae]MCV7104327.1 cyclase family protein [Mycolicibacterium chitae]BBZ02019.1 cyclase [Mycolicibacterium chitae]VEG50838.1 cyclase family protein [Mycolicibacterium chitae]
MPRLIELSRLMKPAANIDVPPEYETLRVVLGPQIEYGPPATTGLEHMQSVFDCPAHDLPNGEGWGEDSIVMSSHCNTHVDAPLHSGSQCEGRPARTITDIELDELYRPGIVLDVRQHVAPREAISIEALAAAIDAAGRPITAGDAVLIRSGQERYSVSDPEFFQYPGMTAAGTKYLTGMGATILGTDAMAWDRPFPVMKQAYKETGDASQIWDGHFAIQEREAFIVQQLTNLDKLPAHGFMVGFFPLRLYKASAAPARVVAFLED